jgi:lipoprotein NlpI
LSPASNAEAHFFANGSLADAQTDFAEANAVDPKDVFAVLWLDITERRNRLPSRLTELRTKLDMNAWPAPVVRYLLGEVDFAALLATAPTPIRERRAFGSAKRVSSLGSGR